MIYINYCFLILLIFYRETDEFCGGLKGDNEPFKSCRDHVDPAFFYDSCVLDACASDDPINIITQV